MTERVLREYFENKISYKALKEDLKDSIKKASFDTSHIDIIKIESETEYKIESHHMVQLLNDTIYGKLTVGNLETITACLIFSEYFFWDSDSEMGKRIEAIIFDLDHGDLNKSITTKQLEQWLKSLDNGFN